MTICDRDDLSYHEKMVALMDYFGMSREEAIGMLADMGVDE